MTEREAHTLVNEYFQAVIAGNNKLESDEGFIQAANRLSIAYRNLIDTLKKVPE